MLKKQAPREMEEEEVDVEVKTQFLVSLSHDCDFMYSRSSIFDSLSIYIHLHTLS